MPLKIMGNCFFTGMREEETVAWLTERFATVFLRITADYRLDLPVMLSIVI